jgi:hypothetical protein
MLMFGMAALGHGGWASRRKGSRSKRMSWVQPEATGLPATINAVQYIGAHALIT